MASKAYLQRYLSGGGDEAKEKKKAKKAKKAKKKAKDAPAARKCVGLRIV